MLPLTTEDDPLLNAIAPPPIPDPACKVTLPLDLNKIAPFLPNEFPICALIDPDDPNAVPDWTTAAVCA